jgi:uncharacterized protein (DUF2336 family)
MTQRYFLTYSLVAVAIICPLVWGLFANYVWSLCRAQTGAPLPRKGAMDANRSLIAELEDAIESGSKDKRVDTLRRITDLFVSDADRFTNQQIEVFDDVLGHLIKRIEGKALAELSRRLGPINNAPVEIVRRLARDDDIAVAEPILTQSARLNDGDLIEIANTKTPAHLLAISARSQIGAEVTDVLLQRGDRNVFRRLAANSGANFSEGGFATLVKHSERDGELAEKVGLRLDVPLRLFRELLMRATEAVRARLLALAGPESREQIQRVLATITEDARQEASFQNEHNYAEAQARVLAMRKTGELNEAAVVEFAKAGRHADMVAALSVLSGAPLKLVENLMQSDHREAIIVICKAAALNWPTVRMILTCRSIGHSMSDQDLDAARIDYYKLSQSNASRVLRFWQVRHTASNNSATPAPSSPHALPMGNIA